MAGHSKWKKVKHKKGKADDRKGKLFSKLSKNISIAAKMGGVDPNMNFRLKSAVQAAKDANIVYTDVWSSMGEEKEQAEKEKAFLSFSVDEHLLSQASDNAIVLHCLPAYRSKEIT